MWPRRVKPASKPRNDWDDFVEAMRSPGSLLSLSMPNPSSQKIEQHFAEAIATLERLAQRPPAIDLEKLEALKVAEPYKVQKKAPDYIHALTGWRAWKVVEGGTRLAALGQKHVWPPRKQTEAECTNGSIISVNPLTALREHAQRHKAPNKDCTCGVWAFKDLDRLVKAVQRYSDIQVLGKVSLWGTVVETENGFRAEKAYPSELWIFNEELESLGLIYDVPVRCNKP